MTGGPDLAPVPRPALILGLAGLIPFAWGAVTVLDPAFAVKTLPYSSSAIAQG